MASERGPLLRSRAAGWLLAAGVLLTAVPASAQEIAQVFVAKVASFLVVTLLASFVFQVAFVHLGARFLRLDGGPLLALAAVLLGGVMAVGLAIAASFTVFAMPAPVQGVVVSAAATVGGGLAIKLLFKAPFAKAILIYLVAVTLNSIAVATVLILMY